jgi:hypothetical protein
MNPSNSKKFKKQLISAIVMLLSWENFKIEGNIFPV